ncbi:hypothetical protein EJ08DRAFT_633660 [Tothia fuscella]|uniref:Uncharacterized protein n=1 Tax=Tothia fuscella TaxID=1048955 RepID=A0A9P4NRY9_9PEZI|nr:hypothetical protein EJ08DRAFT_633660 [Tothia fuscella]
MAHRGINTNNDVWSGGKEAVAKDARNATSISVVANTYQTTTTWHLFYVDQQNHIREKVRKTPSTTWTEGALTKPKATAMNDPHVTFQFCPDQKGGIQAFYATDPQTIQRINWIYGADAWMEKDDFTANGHVGMACYTWGAGTAQYKMFVSLNNEVKVSWKDTNTSVATTAKQPANIWTNSTVSISGDSRITGSSFSEYLIMQTPDRSSVGHNITLDAENTRSDSAEQFTFDGTTILGTHMWLWGLPTKSGDKQLTIFHQTNGSDVTMIMRDMVTTQSLIRALRIPQA